VAVGIDESSRRTFSKARLHGTRRGRRARGLILRVTIDAKGKDYSRIVDPYKLSAEGNKNLRRRKALRGKRRDL